MDDVHLVDYDLRWPALYAAEAARMQAALPAGLVHAVEHFGSTAIPGMVAKPVIDILVAVRSVEQARTSEVTEVAGKGRCRSAGRWVLVHPADRERVARMEEFWRFGMNEDERAVAVRQR